MTKHEEARMDIIVAIIRYGADPWQIDPEYIDQLVDLLVEYRERGETPELFRRRDFRGQGASG